MHELAQGWVWLVVEGHGRVRHLAFSVPWRNMPQLAAGSRERWRGHITTVIVPLSSRRRADAVSLTSIVRGIWREHCVRLRMILSHTRVVRVDGHELGPLQRILRD